MGRDMHGVVHRHQAAWVVIRLIVSGCDLVEAVIGMQKSLSLEDVVVSLDDVAHSSLLGNDILLIVDCDVVVICC